MPGSSPLSDFITLTPGVYAEALASILRLRARNRRAATSAARKYPIPATAITVVAISTAKANACGITESSLAEWRRSGGESASHQASESADAVDMEVSRMNPVRRKPALTRYSYLSASIGSRFAAFHAG